MKLVIPTACLLATLVMGGCPDPQRAARPDRAAPPAARSAGAPALPTAGEEDPTAVVAVVGERKITLGELDESAKTEMIGARLEYQKKRFEVRRSALEEMVIKTLLDSEAAHRKLADAEALIKAVVEDGTPAPSEDEIKVFWEKAKEDPRMGDTTLEKVRAQLVPYLHQQKKQEAFSKLITSLRTAAGVKMMLEPPRLQVEAKGPATGKADAPVTIVEFSDFECPYCSKAEPVLSQVRTIYGEKVNVVFRHFPLPFHKSAPKAAEAAACADDQGKFWKMHAVLFANQKALAVDDLKAHARSIEGLDAVAFDACLDGGQNAKLVQADMAAGKALGVTGTPAFFINGIELGGAQPLEAFQKIIDQELASLASE